MNRRGFLRAVGATGLTLLCGRGPVAAETPAPEKAEEAIRRALRERRMVEFRYHGHLRCVEPHALGRVGGGRRALLGWQIAGGSRSEPPPGWRTFVLDEIEALAMRPDGFAPRGDYRSGRGALKQIEAEVAPPPGR